MKAKLISLRYSRCLAGENSLDENFALGTPEPLFVQVVNSQAGAWEVRREALGFTLIELLVVIAILVILASLLLPVLGKTKAKAHQIACLNNYRQLQLCWHMYVDDNQDALPPNETLPGGGREGWVATARTWIRGNAWTDTSSSNIESGVLFPYNRSVKIYKCPSDKSTVRDDGKIPRFRSVSMNMYMNHIPNPTDRACWHAYSQIKDPPPANAFVFIDEHENSIDNARFALAGRGDWVWIDFPATRHNNSCVLSFADGHSESWRWLEPNTIQAGRLKPWIQNVSGVPGTDRDLRRIHNSIPVFPAF